MKLKTESWSSVAGILLCTLTANSVNINVLNTIKKCIKMGNTTQKPETFKSESSQHDTTMTNNYDHDILPPQSHLSTAIPTSENQKDRESKEKFRSSRHSHNRSVASMSFESHTLNSQSANDSVKTINNRSNLLACMGVCCCNMDENRGNDNNQNDSSEISSNNESNSKSKSKSKSNSNGNNNNNNNNNNNTIRRKNKNSNENDSNNNIETSENNDNNGGRFSIRNRFGSRSKSRNRKNSKSTTNKNKNRNKNKSKLKKENENANIKENNLGKSRNDGDTLRDTLAISEEKITKYNNYNHKAHSSLPSINLTASNDNSSRGTVITNTTNTTNTINNNNNNHSLHATSAPHSTHGHNNHSGYYWNRKNDNTKTINSINFNNHNTTGNNSYDGGLATTATTTTTRRRRSTHTHYRFIMLGIDFAGKTSILKRLQTPLPLELPESGPTIAFNSYRFDYNLNGNSNDFYKYYNSNINKSNNHNNSNNNNNYNQNNNEKNGNSSNDFLFDIDSYNPESILRHSMSSNHPATLQHQNTDHGNQSGNDDNHNHNNNHNNNNNHHTNHNNQQQQRQDTISFRIYDIGGAPVARDLWHHYFPSASAVIYVIDGTSSREKLRESKACFDSLLQSSHLSHIPWLIYINKLDLIEPTKTLYYYNTNLMTSYEKTSIVDNDYVKAYLNEHFKEYYKKQNNNNNNNNNNNSSNTNNNNQTQSHSRGNFTLARIMQGSFSRSKSKSKTKSKSKPKRHSDNNNNTTNHNNNNTNEFETRSRNHSRSKSKSKSKQKSKSKDKSKHRSSRRLIKRASWHSANGHVHAAISQTQRLSVTGSTRTRHGSFETNIKSTDNTNNTNNNQRSNRGSMVRTSSHERHLNKGNNNNNNENSKDKKSNKERKTQTPTMRRIQFQKTNSGASYINPKTVSFDFNSERARARTNSAGAGNNTTRVSISKHTPQTRTDTPRSHAETPRTPKANRLSVFDVPSSNNGNAYDTRHSSVSAGTGSAGSGSGSGGSAGPSPNANAGANMNNTNNISGNSNGNGIMNASQIPSHSYSLSAATATATMNTTTGKTTTATTTTNGLHSHQATSTHVSYNTNTTTTTSSGGTHTTHTTMLSDFSNLSQTGQTGRFTQNTYNTGSSENDTPRRSRTNINSSNNVNENHISSNSNINNNMVNQNGLSSIAYSVPHSGRSSRSFRNSLDFSKDYYSNVNYSNINISNMNNGSNISLHTTGGHDNNYDTRRNDNVMNIINHECDDYDESTSTSTNVGYLGRIGEKLRSARNRRKSGDSDYHDSRRKTDRAIDKILDLFEINAIKPSLNDILSLPNIEYTLIYSLSIPNEILQLIIEYMPGKTRNEMYKISQLQDEKSTKVNQIIRKSNNKLYFESKMSNIQENNETIANLNIPNTPNTNTVNGNNQNCSKNHTPLMGTPNTTNSNYLSNRVKMSPQLLQLQLQQPSILCDKCAACKICNQTFDTLEKCAECANCDCNLRIGQIDFDYSDEPPQLEISFSESDDEDEDGDDDDNNTEQENTHTQQSISDTGGLLALNVYKRKKDPNRMGFRPYEIVKCSAKTGEGLWQGIDWIIDTLQEIERNASIKSSSLKDGRFDANGNDKYSSGGNGNNGVGNASIVGGISNSIKHVSMQKMNSNNSAGSGMSGFSHSSDDLQKSMTNELMDGTNDIGNTGSDGNNSDLKNMDKKTIQQYNIENIKNKNKNTNATVKNMFGIKKQSKRWKWSWN